MLLVLKHCFLFAVLQEVETKIEGFRQHLKQKLAELPSPLEDQKKVIRYEHAMTEIQTRTS